MSLVGSGTSRRLPSGTSGLWVLVSGGRVMLAAKGSPSTTARVGYLESRSRSPGGASCRGGEPAPLGSRSGS